MSVANSKPLWAAIASDASSRVVQRWPLPAESRCLSEIQSIPLETSTHSICHHANELSKEPFNTAGWPKNKPDTSKKHWVISSQREKTHFLQTSYSRIDAHISEILQASCADVEQPGGQRKQNTEKRKQKCVWLTYLIEKGEHCQPIWLISGFSKALVLVRIVMDNMELKDKVEIQNRLGAKVMPGNLLINCLQSLC